MSITTKLKIDFKVFLTVCTDFGTVEILFGDEAFGALYNGLYEPIQLSGRKNHMMGHI